MTMPVTNDIAIGWLGFKLDRLASVLNIRTTGRAIRERRRSSRNASSAEATRTSGRVRGAASRDAVPPSRTGIWMKSAEGT